MSKASVSTTKGIDSSTATTGFAISSLIVSNDALTTERRGKRQFPTSGRILSEKNKIHDD